MKRRTIRVLHLLDIAGVAINLCDLFQRHEWQTRLLVTTNTDRRGWPYYPDKPWIIKLPRTNRWSGLFKLAAYLRINGRHIDVLHGHSLGNLLISVAGPRKFIAHLHGSDLREVASSRSLVGWMFRRAILKAQKVLVSTPDLLPHARAVGVPADRLVFLPNPIDLQAFKSFRSSIEWRTGDETIVLHPALIQPVKHTERLIEAFHHVALRHNVKLVMLDNPAENPAADKVFRRINEIGLESKVLFHGRVPHSLMPQCLNAADIVADQFGGLPLFGQVTLEAMACEKPVIASKESDPSFYGVNAPVLAATTSTEIEQRLMQLLENRDVWADFGRRGRDWVTLNHSSDMIFARLAEIYSATCT